MRLRLNVVVVDFVISSYCGVLRNLVKLLKKNKVKGEEKISEKSPRTNLESSKCGLLFSKHSLMEI